MNHIHIRYSHSCVSVSVYDVVVYIHLNCFITFLFNENDISVDKDKSIQLKTFTFPCPFFRFPSDIFSYSDISMFIIFANNSIFINFQLEQKKNGRNFKHISSSPHSSSYFFNFNFFFI